jgi:predicted RNA-binding protein with TRAM domain
VPRDLIAEVGATMRCQLTSQGTVYGVTITVSSVTDGNARFCVIVDDAPKGG